MADMFKALVAEQSEDKKVTAAIRDMADSELPDGDVTVDIAYSCVNYKDGLALGGGGIIRKFPMVPGIDFAGTVSSSSSPDYKEGDQVVLNGWGASERFWGGYAQRQRVSADVLVPLPAALTCQQAMAIGTAGYTAMLCVMGLERGGVTPDQGEILVTGAAGGVGSVAIAILKHLGFTVVASTGRAEESDYLKSLGASEIIARDELSRDSKPMEAERWAGVVDAVGDTTLATAIAGTKYGGTVTACGLAGGMKLPTNVFPFILRGVQLLGIDSVMCPKPRRVEAWSRLATDLPIDKLEALSTVVPLADVQGVAADIVQGKVRGRVIVDVNA